MAQGAGGGEMALYLGDPDFWIRSVWALEASIPWSLALALVTGEWRIIPAVVTVAVLMFWAVERPADWRRRYPRRARFYGRVAGWLGWGSGRSNASPGVSSDSRVADRVHGETGLIVKEELEGESSTWESR